MSYRKSHYCIDVKLDKADNQYVLVHSYTGAIDIVNEDLVKYLKSAKEFDKGSFPFSNNTFDLLAKRGHITQKTFEEEKEHVRRFAALLHNNAQESAMSFLFMVTYDCNFRCTYCYESGISKHGNEWSRKKFTPTLVDRAYEAITELTPDETKRWKQITLYGGEPLLKDNVDIVEYIVEKGAALGYSFSAVTNGYDLAYYKKVLANPAMKQLQITLDGTKDTHNSRRYHYQLGDSFDIIFENIGLALDNDVAVNVRFNADSNNFEETKKLQEMFDYSGFSKKKNFHLYIGLLFDDNGVKNDGISYLSKTEFYDLHNGAGFDVNHQDYGLYQKLMTSIHKGTYLSLNSIHCGAQANMYIFDPYGKMYSCWETIGIKKHIWGDYSNGVVFSEERNRWRNRHIATTPKCNACAYSLFCGAGCSFKTLKHEGSLKKSYCDNYADIFKLSVNKVFDDYKKNNVLNNDNEQ